ncbi:MAG: peptidylprolyl isomerase [Spirochaetales bacterium]|nr:peptidylprolyl isomerase [Spirochaetales bacterium]
MKKIFLISICIISSLSLFSANAFDTVIAQVKLTKTELITLSSVEEKINLAEKQLGKTFSSAEKDLILDSIISNELVKQAAVRDGIVITEEMVLNMLKAQAAQTGQNATDQMIKDALANQYSKPYNVVLEALIEQLTVQEYIKKAGEEDLKKLATPPTNDEITNFYNSNKTKFVNPDMVRVNHIFFSTKGKTVAEADEQKKKAETAMLQIKNGEKTFQDLVQEVSDDRNSVKNGGELGFISRDEPTTVQILGNDFINQVFNLSMDNIHGVLQSASGYHIVVITEKRSARILKETDLVNPSSTITVKQYISQSLQQQKANQAFNTVTELVIDRLKKESVIRIIDKSIPWK